MNNDKSQIKILIIEDDLIIAENLRENLYEMGYNQVSVVKNSKEALQSFDTFMPDLCLVDVQLNGSELDGIQIIEKVNISSEVPIIYLTSFSDENVMSRAKKTKPSGYLVKPASKAQIDVAIDIAINNFSEKLKNQEHIVNSIEAKRDFVFIKVKCNNVERFEKFHKRDIMYVRANGSYATFFTFGKAHTMSLNLRSFLEALQSIDMIRCHRSYAVNINHIHSFDNQSLYVTQQDEVVSIPISEQYKMTLNEVLPRM